MIFLIDDDEIQNLINSKVISLVNPNVKVQSFTSANEALEELRKTPTTPDLIFLDINMPQMNGWDFLEAYKLDQGKVPVYMLSSSINIKDIEMSGSYSIVRSFISKPLVMDRLKDILSENEMI